MCSSFVNRKKRGGVCKKQLCRDDFSFSEDYRILPSTSNTAALAALLYAALHVHVKLAGVT